MKKHLRFFGLMIACFALFQAQSVKAVNYAATLPGNSVTTANTTSFIRLDGAKLKAKITSLPFTIEMAFKPTAYNNYGGLWSDRSSGTSNTIQYGTGVNYLRVDYNGTNVFLPLSAVPVLNAWNHVALVVTSTSLKLVLNGVSYERTGMTNTTVPFSGSSFIGQDSATATTLNRTVAGQFDEIRFWNTARTDAELNANKFKSLTGTETGLVAYYNFDGQNTNDVTSNAINAFQPATALTFNNLSTDASIKSSADLSGINFSQGVLGADFAAATTTYTAYVPPTSTNTTVVTGTPIGFLPVSQTIDLTPTSPTASLAVTSMDATTNKTYTINVVKTDMNTYWSGNGVTLTSTRAYANLWGWKCSNSENTWGLTSANRYIDILATANTWWYPTTATAWGGRALYLRWDGTGNNSLSSVYTYPVSLTAGKSYTFTYKYAWNSNATPPVFTHGIATDQLGSNIIASDTAKASSKALLLKSKSFTFSAPSTGTYYIALGSSTASLCVVADLAIALDATTQSITSSQTALAFDASNLTKTFIITGANLTSDITLTAPTGVTLDKTTITAAQALAGVTVTATYGNSIAILNGSITATSGTVTKTIGVNASNDAACFTKLYPTLTNLITDPYLNSLSTYAGWGTKSVVTDLTKAYCGISCVSDGNGTSVNSGSMDFNLTGKVLANTVYRVRAMVWTVGTGLSFEFGVGGCGVNGSTTDFNTLVTTNDTWQPFDMTFTTGTLAATQGLYFNNSNTSTGFLAYIDNYEMYAVPKTYTSAASLTFLGAGTKKVAVRAVNLSNNIAITASTGYSVTPSTLLSTVSGSTSDSIAVTFAGGTSANGYVYFTSGTVKDSLQVTGTVAPSILSNKTGLVFDELNLSDSIIVNGGNLTSDIAITAPAGITLSLTSIPKASASNVKVKATYDGTTSGISGNITLTSGTTVTNVSVAASLNSACFTPLYSKLTNIIPSPQLNTLTGFGGWGHKDVVSGEAYCGKNCVKFSAVTNGWPDGAALDVNPVAWVAGDTYRLRAMVKAVDGTFAFLANGTSPNVTIPVAMSGNNWVKIDTTFTVGTSPSSNFFTFNNVDGASTGKIAYIDNYELYDITSLITNVANVASQQSLNVYKQDNQIVADFSLAQSSSVEFSVFSIQGQLISKEKATFAEGKNHKVISSTLASGVYLVNMVSDGKSITRRVIK